MKIIPARIIAVYPDKVVVDIGEKRDAVVWRDEFGSDDIIEEGKEISVLFENIKTTDGEHVVSYKKAKMLKALEEIEKLYKENNRIRGKVLKKSKGGYIVDVGCEAFMPESHSIMNENDKEKELDFKIIEFDKKTKNIVVSRKKFLEEIIFENIKVGNVHRVKVISFTKFGAFVDFGGIDALLHKSDISWKHIDKPESVLKIGEEIDVMVLNFSKEKSKISVGLKQLFPNPWENFKKNHSVGSKITGEITKVISSGMFILLPEGIEGFISVKDISWDGDVKCSADIKVGQKVETIILNVDFENEKISLGIKQLTEDPYLKYKSDMVIDGRVVKLTGFGLFVQIEPGIDGFVHISEVSENKVEKVSDVFKVNDEITGKIIKIDKQKRKIELSVKQFLFEKKKKEVDEFIKSQNAPITIGDIISSANSEE